MNKEFSITMPIAGSITLSVIAEDKEEEHVLYKVPDPLDYRQLDLEEF